MTTPESPPPASAAPPHRIPVLDGVRGVAICLVLLVHFTPDLPMPNRALEWLKKGCQTGWIGVDLFFVLSGMLITDILLRSRGSAGAARVFYARRCLRVLPLYLTTLAVVFGLLPLLVNETNDPAFATMQSTQGWYWAHCANVIAFLHGFPAMASRTVNLQHLWSLAVEEHFYLLWPLLVWRVPSRRLIWVAAAIIVLAMGIRIGGWPAIDAERIPGFLVQTPTRMDGLAIGAAVAILFRQVSPARLRTVAMGLLPLTGTLLAGEFLIRKGLWSTAPLVATVGLTVIAVFFASGIVLLRTGSPTAWPVRLIDNPALRFFGQYSYGIYVLHGVLTPTLDRWFSTDAALAACGSPVAATLFLVAAKTAVSVGAALLSWHLLEAPCLGLKRWFEYGTGTGSSAAAG